MKKYKEPLYCIVRYLDNGHYPADLSYLTIEETWTNNWEKASKRSHESTRDQLERIIKMHPDAKMIPYPDVEPNG